jgi:hypothetical protein
MQNDHPGPHQYQASSQMQQAPLKVQTMFWFSQHQLHLLNLSYKTHLL